MKRLALIAALLALIAPAAAQFKGGGGFGTPGFTVPVSSTASLACSYTPVTTGTQGTAYTGATPSASGGTPAYTFSETGTLPGGLSISSSTGVISGTPTASGSFPTIQVKVTDSTSTVANCGASFTLVIAPAGCSDTNATAWVNAVVTAGGTVSGGQQTNVCNLIVALKGHSLFAKLDRMWLYASENATQAKIDIINLSTHTVSGTPTFTASQGYTGNGTDFINTNYVPSTGTNFGLSNADIGIYIRNNRTASGNVTQLGGLDANQTTLQINSFGTQYIGTINTNWQILVGSATTSAGLYVMSLVSNASNLYKNGSSIGSSSSVPGARTAIALYALALNNSGTAAQQCVDQVAVVFAGGALTSTDNTNLSADVNGIYMTALGTNVY